MISILGRSMVLIALAVSVLGAFAGIAGVYETLRASLEVVSHCSICRCFCDDGSNWTNGICTHYP